MSSSIDTSRISPSAHYTGFVWFRNGLSAEGFQTPKGRLTYAALRPINAIIRGIVGADMETFLLHRHHVIDELLHQAIKRDGITQVVELACGLSPRGYIFKQSYPEITYIEADLPDMAAHKKQLLSELPLQHDKHEVRTCNILSTEGGDSLEALLNGLDKTQKTLVITEGLVNYFDTPVIEGVWTRLATGLKDFPLGRYITDLYPKFEDHPFYRFVTFMQKIIGVFTRGDFPLHYASDEAMHKGFSQCGFNVVNVHDPKSYYDQLPIPKTKIATLVRVIESTV